MHIRYLAAVILVTACSGGDSGSPAGPSGPSNPSTPSTTVASLQISGAQTVEVGQSIKLTVEARNANGATVTTPAITWSSSDNTLIAVAADGTVTAPRIGSATITAAAGSVSASTSVSSTLAPFTFSFAAGTSASDQQIIRDGIHNAYNFEKQQTFRPITAATTVSGVLSATGCSQGGAAAFTGQGAVTFCLANPGWLNNGPIMKQKIVQHELFHVWQFEKGWIANPNTAGSAWVIEGSAELMGFRGIEAKGLMTFTTAIGCQVKESTDFATQKPPGLPSLQTVEVRQAFQTTVGPLYTHSMLAMDRLVGSNLIKLQTYGDAIATGTTLWPNAFLTVFGTPTATFYSSFPAYLATLPVPPNYLCGV